MARTPNSQQKATQKDHLDIYTDGACSGNPGAGGWAAILVYQGIEKVISGGAPQTTNNRMELQAVIEGLKAVNRPLPITVHTDSNYIVKAFTEGWLDNWKKKGWVNAAKKPVSNRDQWETLDELVQRQPLQWVKVKGHSGHSYNERCDSLAVEESMKWKQDR